MSDPLRIGLVAEGQTDKIVVKAVLDALMDDRPYVLRLLQPEESLPLEPPSSFTGKGKGWGGVYLWCKEALLRSEGTLRDDPLYLEYDILIIHLDADVAAKTYADYELHEPINDLPCVVPCPPAAATTDRLRRVLLRWIGESEVPPKTVLCTPSKSTETWVVAALFPDDKEMVRKGWECHEAPDNRLSTQPKGRRVTKSEMGYKQIQPQIQAAWPLVQLRLLEAARFSADFTANLPS